ncbi:MAG: S8 family serine peptidase [Bacteroidetes bacterium]|nr:S8 family serine peptidase [Bacteroidota bacterium]
MPKFFFLPCCLLIFSQLQAQIEHRSHQIVVCIQPAFHASLNKHSESKTGVEEIDALNARYAVQKVHFLRLGKDNPNKAFSILFPDHVDLQQVLPFYQTLQAVLKAEIDGVGSIQGGREKELPSYSIPPAQVLFTPNDPLFGRQWSLNNNGSFPLSTATPGADIDMLKAWEIEQGDENIIVCVMDSGAKLDHPEFQGRIWVNSAEIPGNNLDDDQNGYIDDVNGWDFASNDKDATDDLGHGTNVCGIIGANLNNNLGYAGIDGHCKLMVLKGIDQNNFGYYSWWAEAIEYAVDHGARVINLSVGGSSPSDILGNAITYALYHQVSCVASMMNTNISTPYYPAGYNGVVAVGSTNPNDYRSKPFFWDTNSGSCYGNHISIVAPGNYIYGLNQISNTNYSTYWGGTSQAAPHVSGTISLLLAQNPDRTPAQIKTLLEVSAEDKVGNPNEDVLGWDKYYGHGRLNAYNALYAQVLDAYEAPSNAELQIYPSPNNGSFHIRRQTDEVGICRLFDLAGNLLHQTNVGAQNLIKLDLNLPTGVYLIEIESEGRLERGKMCLVK